jgi:hypothetical protein
MEIWEIIDGTDERYSVSSSGKVMANWGDIPQRNATKRVRIEQVRTLNPWVHTNGYMRVALGRNKYRYVHRLVAVAFVSNQEGKPFVDHIDGDRTNNAASNLRWVTAQENAIYGGKRHSFAAQIAASKNRAFHITRISEYRRLIEEGVSLREIARRYNTSHGAISYALRAAP